MQLVDEAQLDVNLMQLDVKLRDMVGRLLDSLLKHCWSCRAF